MTGRLASTVARLSAVALLSGLSLLGHLYFLDHSDYKTQTHFDEAIYVQTAYDWASYVRDGHPAKVLEPALNDEHPALVKLTYATAILADWQVNGYEPLADAERDNPCQRPEDCPAWVQAHPGSPCCGPGFVENATLQRYRNDGRAVSVAAGVATVAVLTLLTPWAGLLAIVSTLLTQYTSLAFLEALGNLFGALAVVLFIRMRPGRPKLVAVAVAVGLAAACKYYYPLAGLAIALAWIITDRARLTTKAAVIASGAAITFTAFAVADLPFFTVGFRRSLAELTNHGIQYMSDASALPNTPNLLHPHWYSALNGLAGGFDSWYFFDGRIHFVDPSPFILPGDLLIVGLVGIAILRWPLRHDVVRIWLGLAVAAIVLYPVKHNQYLMLAVTPLILTAASVPEAAGHWISQRRRVSGELRAGANRDSKQGVRPRDSG